MHYNNIKLKILLTESMCLIGHRKGMPMKKIFIKMKRYLLTSFFLPVLTFGLSACGQSESPTVPPVNIENEVKEEEVANREQNESDETAEALEVRFGDDGEPYILHLYDNDTAESIARSIGTNDWRLPIYHYDDFENSDVMQYYDIPSRYEISYEPETITSEKAGEVYYSEPNRIVLFYKDAEITGEYARVGYFDYSEEFLSAVENNPVLEGWGNKIILIDNIEQ